MSPESGMESLACQSQFRLAKELEGAERLQRVATQLFRPQDGEALLEEILDAAMAILHSNFASIQIFRPGKGASGALQLVSHRGLSAQAAKSWKWIYPSMHTSCAEVLRSHRRVVIPDVRSCAPET